jgi:hypothetical protein
MSKRQERIERIGEIERECQAAASAVRLLMEELHRDPNFLDDDALQFQDAVRLKSKLEATFVIRLFAEFEAGLRNYWFDGMSRRTKPPMTDLVDAIGAYRAIPRDRVDGVHDVRTFRNSLVHEGNEETRAMPLKTAKSWLRKYANYLPLDW